MVYEVENPNTHEAAEKSEPSPPTHPECSWIRFFTPFFFLKADYIYKMCFRAQAKIENI